MTHPEIDLHPYGISAILNRDINIDSLDSSYLTHGVRKLNFLGNTRGFHLSEKNYIAIELLSEDEFGKSYRCIERDSHSECTIKTYSQPGTNLSWILREFIIQILVSSLSASQPKGPYAPLVYEFAYDPATDELHIRSQRTKNTLENQLLYMDEDEQEDLRRDAMSQIETASAYLGAVLYFQCYEWKDNMIVFIRSPDDTERWWRLGDFSETSVTYDGVYICGRKWMIK